MIQWLESEPGACDTALSLAIDFMALDRSEHPLEKSTNQILSLLQDILQLIPRREASEPKPEPKEKCPAIQLLAPETDGPRNDESYPAQG
jgi:hypothetical protein